MNTVSKTENKISFRERVQHFGTKLSGMIMPNIGAFIAWGLITALFIPTGWTPNDTMYQLVGPMIVYMLPLLIGFTGGKMLHEFRGGVVGAIATMGVIVGADIPMFLGAMIMGPLGGLVIKKFDELVDGKIKPGFEMLVNNFSSGILGAILAVLGLIVVGPIVESATDVLGSWVGSITEAGLLPLTNILVEPAKILFLNNAINHGVFTPLGTAQAIEYGQSILFLIETNPGPGMGVLVAFIIFGKGSTRATASAAAIIHFFGGIHEIYFPFILMKPQLLLAVILGGVSGTFIFDILGAGLTAPASPGSIIAILGMTAQGSHLAVILGVLVATGISFAVAMPLIKFSKDTDSDELNEATTKMEELKGKESKVAAIVSTKITSVIFACDAGMGSSAMGSSILRKKFKDAGIDIEVTNVAIAKLPKDAQVVITHKDLTDRAKTAVPNANHISVENFLNSPKYDELVQNLKK